MEPKEPEETAVKLMLEFDPRLAEVWLAVLESDLDLEEIGEKLAWFLRMSYLQGYRDALSEPERGLLFRRLGVPVPARTPQTPRGARRGGRR